MRLTESQVSFFHDNGYLLLEDVLDANDLGPVIAEYEAKLSQNAPRNCMQRRKLAIHTPKNRLRNDCFTLRMRHKK